MTWTANGYCSSWTSTVRSHQHTACIGFYKPVVQCSIADSHGELVSLTRRLLVGSGAGRAARFLTATTREAVAGRRRRSPAAGTGVVSTAWAAAGAAGIASRLDEALAAGACTPTQAGDAGRMCRQQAAALGIPTPLLHLRTAAGVGGSGRSRGHDRGGRTRP